MFEQKSNTNKYLTRVEIDLYQELLDTKAPDFIMNEMPYGLDLKQLHFDLDECSGILNNEAVILHERYFYQDRFKILTKLVLERDKVEDVKFLSLMFSVLLILFRIYKLND